MPEVTAPQAAAIIDVSLPTVHRKVDAGLLPARQQGTGERRFIYVEIEALREFAAEYGYRFDEGIAQQFSE